MYLHHAWIREAEALIQCLEPYWLRWLDTPFVQIHMVEGRTDEQREKLAKLITDAVVETLQVQKESVWISFIDMPKTHFATGGVLRSKK